MSLHNKSIQLKIEKAKALMGEVDLLLENKFYTTAVSRIYYSCFHADTALLLIKGFAPKTHSGVVAMLGLHFVNPGIFDKKYSAFFSNLMQERMDDDYSDFLIIDFEEIEEFVEPGKAFLHYTLTLVESELSKGMMDT
ncbi:HEPN domain-containing protein [soil metagenome]